MILKNLHLLSLLGSAPADVEYPLREWRPSRHWPISSSRRGWRGGELDHSQRRRRLAQQDAFAGQWQRIAAGLNNDRRLVLLWGNEKEKETRRGRGPAERRGCCAPFMRFRRPDLFHRPGAARRFRRYAGAAPGRHDPHARGRNLRAQFAACATVRCFREARPSSASWTAVFVTGANVIQWSACMTL